MRRLFFLLLLAFTQIAAASPVAPSQTPFAPVPLVAVLANPERFDGQIVSVEGYLNLEFEGDALYLSRSDFENGLSGNAVWVDGPKFEEPEAREALTGRFVSLTGRYVAGRRGHMGRFSGSFEDVSTIETFHSRQQSLHWMFRLRANLPWPLMIGVLSAATLTMIAGLTLLGRSRRRPAIVTWSAVIVVGATAAFSILRLWEAPMVIHRLIRIDAAELAWPLALELAVGIIALIATAIFAWRRALFACVLLAAVQLIVPAAIEIRAFQIFDVPLSIRSAQPHDVFWERSAASDAAT